MADDSSNDSYPWYKVVEADAGLLQGDFINECPVVVPLLSGVDITEEMQNLSVEVKFIDAVILSHSCDLEQKKTELVLLCPVLPLSEIQAQNPGLRARDIKRSLKQGTAIGFHLMNKCSIDGFERELMVAEFKNVYAMPFDFLADYAQRYGPRLRLLPPYVEHLSQAFARHFMRVGLPIPIEMD